MGIHLRRIDRTSSPSRQRGSNMQQVLPLVGWHLSIYLKRTIQLLLRGFHVGLKLFVLLNFLACGKDSGMIVKIVGVNMIPKAGLDSNHLLLNHHISKSGSATTDKNSTILLNDSFDKLKYLVNV